jgi:hypothetical protein
MTIMRIHRASGRMLALATLSLLLCAAPALPQALEYDLKAALLFKIAKFIRWPDGSFAAGNLQLCIIGRDDFGTSADELIGKRLQGQSVAIVRLKPQQSAAGCHIIFISRSEHEHLPSILAGLARSPALTVSDIDGFAAQGGVVGFATRDKKISFEINAAAGKRAGLEISAQLLQLATLVGDARPENTP